MQTEPITGREGTKDKVVVYVRDVDMNRKVILRQTIQATLPRDESVMFNVQNRMAAVIFETPGSARTFGDQLAGIPHSYHPMEDVSYLFGVKKMPARP